jgi:ribosomal-protein-alanine N-acetyltransferase
MQTSDLRQVMDIERYAFPSPWPASAYRYEITQNDLSTYLVLKLRHSPPLRRGRVLPSMRRIETILGYGGFWMIVDEAHISTIAVHEKWRRRGLGEMMLVAMIEAALQRGAGEVTLEVRVSNVRAQSLYRKYGFVQVGRRKGYYHDNHEDALIMTTPRVDEPAFLEQYSELQSRLRERLVQRLAR